METNQLLSDQEWRNEDLLDEMATQYSAPKYDPFEIFEPTKSLIREAIKQLKQTCYETIAASNSDHSGFTQILNAPRLEKLNRRIRNYEYRVRGVSKDSPGRITQQDIDRAKEYAIEIYYTGGKLRRTGRTLVGKCPFHSEKTGSFVINTDKNRWQCFGQCITGGDVIDFVMKTQNLDFIQSVKLILKI